jgi:hypothetical protein
MSEDRRYATEVADWCERELKAGKETGHLETRPFVQNAQMIIAALREYAKGNLGAVNSGQSVADIKEHLRTLKKDKSDGSRESAANR